MYLDIFAIYSMNEKDTHTHTHTQTHTHTHTHTHTLTHTYTHSLTRAHTQTKWQTEGNNDLSLQRLNGLLSTLSYLIIGVVG